MTKKITDAQLLGEKGVALIYSRMLDMGFTWHASNASVEAGIDGWIELRDRETGEVANVWLPVQSRARTDLDETEDSVTYSCTQKDLDYWLSGTMPVILVLSRPRTNEAWWTSVKDYFRSREVSTDRKIVFHKERDRLDIKAAERFKQLAITCGSTAYFTPVREYETLISNLFRVTGWPEDIFFATPHLSTDQEVREALKAEVEWPEREWFLHDGRIYSFHCLAMEPWNKICDETTIDTISTDEWADSSDSDSSHLFTRLLNRCMESITGRMRMRFSKEQKCHYFKADTDGRSRKQSYKGRKRKTGRDVVQVYSPEGSEKKYYRHNAFSHRFRHFGADWFLEIEPTYVFTLDGVTPDPKGDDKLAKIKSLEGDAAVAGTILMFADLFQDRDTLYRKKYAFLTIGAIETAVVNATIDDDLWSAFKAAAKPEQGKEDVDFGEGLFS